jgi:hypothetical protein
MFATFVASGRDKPLPLQIIRRIEFVVQFEDKNRRASASSKIAPRRMSEPII